MDRDRVVVWKPVGDSGSAVRVLVYELIDTTEPKVVSEPIIFPYWLDVDSLDHDALRVVLTREVLKIDWKARARHRGGAPPKTQTSVADSMTAAGTIRIDLRSGTIQAEATEGEAQPEPVPDSNRVEYAIGFSWSDAPWEAEGHLVAIIQQKAKGENQLILEKVGSQPMRIELQTGRNPTAIVSADRKFVLTGDSAEEHVTWKLHSVENGEQLVEFASDSLPRDLNVIGQSLFYFCQDSRSGTRQLVLKARSLKDGETLWEISSVPEESGKPPELPPEL